MCVCVVGAGCNGYSMFPRYKIVATINGVHHESDKKTYLFIYQSLFFFFGALINGDVLMSFF